MVERPADVLVMDKANPPRFDWFTRADMALRRVPGLGFLIAVFMLEHEYERGNAFMFLLFATGFSAALLNEFLPKITTGSSPKSSEVPSAPRRRPDPA